MTFEGSQVNIPIKGIMRAGTDNLCADGAMNEVIGMEYKDGSWLPYMLQQTGVMIPGSYGVTKPYVHKTSDGASHYVFICQSVVVDHGVISYRKDLYYEVNRQYGSVAAALLTSNIKDIEFLGNMLCVATDTGMEYYLWKEGTYERYVSAMETEPPLVSLRVTAGMYTKMELTGKIQGCKYVTKIDLPLTTYSSAQQTIGEDTDKETIHSTAVAALGSVKNNGGLIGYSLGCVAYRMKNGDLVLASAPTLLGRPMQKYGSEADIYMWNAEDSSKQFQKDDNTTKELKSYDRTPLEVAAEIAANMLEYGYSIFEMPRNNDWMWFYQQNDSHTDNRTKEGEEFMLAQVGDETYDRATNVPLSVRIAGQSKITYENYFSADNEFIVATDGEGWSAYSDDNKPVMPGLACTRVHIDQTKGAAGTEAHIHKYIYTAYAASNKLQYKVPSLNDIDKSEIASMCIFLSQDIDAYDLSMQPTRFLNNMFYIEGNMLIAEGQDLVAATETQPRDHKVYAQSYIAKQRSYENIIRDIKNIDTLYLVKEIPFESIEESNDWVDVDLEGILGDNLVVREQLPLTAFKRDVILTANSLESYNYRLHAYNYIQELFKGYSLPEFGYYAGDGQHDETVLPHTETISSGVFPLTYKYKWEIKVDIKDENGESRVVNFEDNYLETLRLSLSPIITYPGNDAQSFTIRAYKEFTTREQSYVVYEETHNFSHDWKLGMSYYIDPELKPIVPSLQTGAGVLEPLEPAPSL